MVGPRTGFMGEKGSRPGLHLRWGETNKEGGVTRVGDRRRTLCKWQEGPPKRSTQEGEGHCGETVASVTPPRAIMTLSSMVPSGGRRGSLGTENAEGDGNHNDNSIAQTQSLLLRTKHSKKRRQLGLNNIPTGEVTVKE